MATGIIKNLQPTSTQVLTTTKDSVTLNGKFYKVGNLVQVYIYSSGNVNYGNGWQTLFTGLNSEFQPTGTRKGLLNGNVLIQVDAVDSSNAGRVRINMANVTTWPDCGFCYVI